MSVTLRHLVVAWCRFSRPAYCRSFPDTCRICGVSFAELKGPNARVRLGILRDTALFVGGFSVVFIALGLSATTLGGALFRNQLLLTRVSGIVLVVMALFMIGVHFARVPWLMGEKRFRPKLAALGPFTAPVAGAAFGFGWTPCIGPVLASVLTIAASSSNALTGGLLLAAYSLGLGVPFLLTGLAFGRASQVFKRVRRHYVAINLASAVVLAVFGLLLATNNITFVTIRLQQLMHFLGLDRLVNLG